MLLCWCIGKAASEVKEFYILPVQGKLHQYDKLAVNTIVRNKNGEITSDSAKQSNENSRSESNYCRKGICTCIVLL